MFVDPEEKTQFACRGQGRERRVRRGDAVRRIPGDWWRIRSGSASSVSRSTGWAP